MCHNGDQVGMLSVLPLLYSLHRHPVIERSVHSQWIFYLHQRIHKHIIPWKTGRLDEHVHISVNQFNNKREKHENSTQEMKIQCKKIHFKV
jgi:hypothetical protein